MSQHKRLAKLEAVAKHRAVKDKPIDFVSTYGSPDKYDPDVFELLALSTCRKIILPEQVIDGAQLRIERWGHA
jgi:hypothetical protein